ncbi:hypothetical protein ScPMuIL_017727 [Solemya velum]
MFKTRRDVDRHVSQILGRIRDEKEKNSRGYQIARLYFDIAEYEIAKRYLAAFSSVRENIPQAHKLMGQIHEALNEKQKSVASYKRSLELDDKQKDLVLKICELYCTVDTEPERAKYWTDRAEKLFPNNQTVFKLKERLVNQETNGNVEELEDLIASELVKNPKDVQLRIKLLRLYLVTGRDTEAYNMGVETEKLLAFVDSLNWYECLVQVYQAYQANVKCLGDTGFYMENLTAIASLTYLRLQEKDVFDCVEALHKLDLALYEATQHDKGQPEWQSFLVEMQGRFYFLMGCLLFKRAQNGQLCWRDAVSLASVCFLHSNNYKPIDIKTSWYVQAEPHTQKFYDRLQKVGFYRLSQGGHLFLSIPQTDHNLWAQELTQHLCTPQGKDKLFDTVFTLREMRNAKDRSYLIQSNTYITRKVTCPSKTQIGAYDLVGHMLYPEDLNQIVWLCLQKYSNREQPQPDYHIQIFNSLQYSVPVLTNATPESLCQIDIQAFLYATVYCVGTEMKEKRQILRADTFQPFLPPSCLTKTLCSPEQLEWWEAVYKFFTGTAGDKFARLRVVLRRGVETVRLIGHHGMSVKLILHLASTFDERAKEMKSQCDEGKGSVARQEDLQKRAAFYWGEAAVILERMEKNLTVRMPKERLFPDKDAEPSNVKELVDKARFSLALVAFQRGQFEESLKGFDKLSDPWASFHTAQVYQRLAEDDLPVNGNRSVSFADESNEKVMLMKARDSLYLTVDRLRGNKSHELNNIVSREIDDVVTKLTNLESGEGLLDSIAGLSLVTAPEDPSELTDQETPLSYSTPAVKMKSGPPSRTHLNMSDQTIPRPRPSPERLDLQIKALEISQQTLMKLVMEKTERSDELVRMNRELMDGLRDSWGVIREIREQLKYCVPAPQFPPYQAPPPNGSFMMNSSYRPQQINYPGWMPSQYGYQMPPPPANQNPPHGSMPVYPVPPVPAQLPTQPPQQHVHVGKMAVSHDRIANDSDEEEDDIYYVDGEYYEDNNVPQPSQQPVYVPDTQLVQEWPFGHRAGLEGKSTVTYAPHTAPAAPQTNPQTNPSYILSALKGQSLQYGYQQNAPSMPGPGFFSSPSKQPLGFMGQASTESGLPSKSELAGALSEAAGLIPESSTTMPPNVVAGPSLTAKPSFITSGIPVQSKQPATTSPFTTTASHHLASLLSAPGGPISSPNASSSCAVQQQKPVSFGSFSQNQTDKSASVQPTAIKKDVPKVVNTPTTKEPTSTPVHGSPVASNSQLKQDPATGFISLFSEKGEHLVAINNHPQVDIKVLYSKKEGKGKTLIALSTEPQNYIFSFDVRTMKLRPAYLPNTVSWSGCSTGSNITEIITIRLENADLVERFKKAVEDADRYTSAVEFVKGNLAQTKTDPVDPTKAQDKPASALLSALASKQETREEVPQGQANVFGGFTFSKTPIVQDTDKKKDDIKAVPNKSQTPNTSSTVKPLAGFSFQMSNSPGVASPGFGGSGDKNVLPAPTNSTFGMFNTSSNSTPSFGSLAANSTGQNAFTGTKETKPFSHASPIKSPGREEEGADEYEPNVDFKPVVPLPDLVDVKTGEEDEERLFGARAKLFRFDPDVKQWKERGTGEMKILKHKATGKFRILMRREQVLKLCANHLLTKDLKLTAMPSSEKAWCWNAMDYAEEEMKMEQLSVRFKTQDLALEFKKVFQKCQELEKQSESESSMKGKLEDKKVSSQKPKPKPKDSLSSLFTPKAGAWTCDGCLCQNDGSQTKCPACMTPKPGAPAEKSTDDAANSDSSQKKDPTKAFSFGAAGGFKFESSSPAASTSPFCFGNTDTSKDKQVSDKSAETKETGDSKFTFGTPSKGGFQFGSTTSSGFSFGTPTETVKPEKTTSEKADEKPSIFGAGASPKGFSFSLEKEKPIKSETPGFQFKLDQTKKEDTPKPSSKSPFSFTFNMTPDAKGGGSQSVSSPKSPEIDEHGHYVNKEGDDSHIYFEPVVQLPDKVDVKSGEEEEKVLYKHRAKLYRFQEGEWKERGLGDVKILENLDTGNTRILMRREQILKCCCNHSIQKDMEMNPMPNANGKAWVWHAMDFADGVQKHEQLSIRFKTAEIANEFKSAFDNAKSRLTNEDQTSDRIQCDLVSSSVETPDDTDDVIYLFTEKPDPSFVEKAKQFQLPPHFYLYENKEPCPGCIGCDDGEFKGILSPREKKTETSGDTNKDQEKKDKPAEFKDKKKDEVPFTAFGRAGGGGIDLSFSDLASKSTPTSFSKDPSKPFSWSGAGAQLFGSPGAGGAEGGDDDEVPSSQDIHFEPIVPLPDLVEVKTGEEEEDPVFCHRAKLFRFDESTNQWKEKGIGEMKILKNRHTGRYRLLLRREQVFKLACNHLLTTDFELNPMSTSETSWCWVAQDFSDSEPRIEKLAVKFKTIDLAKQFKIKFEECQDDLKRMVSQSCNSPLPEQAEITLLPTSTIEEEQEEEDNEDDDDDDSDCEDQDDLIFEKRVTFSVKEGENWKKLGTGTLKVIYDEDVSAYRVVTELDDTSEIVCNNLIVMETMVTCDKKKRSCEWSPIDFSTDEPMRRTFCAQFSSGSAMEEFETHVTEGRGLAQESEISERNIITMPQEILVPEVVSHGQDEDSGK